MVLFNHATREMTAKIVYYGPGLCGKTTNLMVIFDKLDPKQKGKMLSLATKTDRTLFFDLLPVDIGKVGAFNLKIQLYTVPGQVFYNETRKLVLKGADAVVFVADSQPSMVESTRESFANLLENLEQNNIDPNDTPIIIQFNKRDIPGVLPVEELQEALGLEGYPYTEASAIKGEGVMETFKLVSKITAKHLLRAAAGRSRSPVEKSEAGRPKAEPEPPSPSESRRRIRSPTPFPSPSRRSTAATSGWKKSRSNSCCPKGANVRPRCRATSRVPVDFEDVEESDAEAMVPVEDTAVAVMDEPVADDRIASLEQKVTSLQSELDSVREAASRRDRGNPSRPRRSHRALAPAPRFLTCQQAPLNLQSPNILFGGTQMRRTLSAVLMLSMALAGCKAKEAFDKAKISQDLDKHGTMDLMKDVSKDKYNAARRRKTDRRADADVPQGARAREGHRAGRARRKRRPTPTPRRKRARSRSPA